MSSLTEKNSFSRLAAESGSIIVGLTGQTGAGKTLVSDVFREQGFDVINCDLSSRKVTEKGSDCNRELRKFFPDCISDELELDRKKMAAKVFTDKKQMALMMSIMKPFLRAHIEQEIVEILKNEHDVLLDAPTLFEAGLWSICGHIVAVVADEETRLQRIIARDGLTEEQALQRMSSQHSEDFFRASCGTVIENNGTEQELREAALSAIEHIRDKRRRAAPHGV